MAALPDFASGFRLFTGQSLNALLARVNGITTTTGVITAGAGSAIQSSQFVASKTVTVTVTDGAGSGTFTLPAGALVYGIGIETPTTIPGTPTNTNIRIGSGANGQQYVADVDAKAQGWIDATIVYAGRNPATTVYYTVASSGGTAASQDGTILLHVEYAVA